MKLFATGLFIAVAITLGITTASGGAASTAHRTLGVVPHHVSHHGTAHRTAPPRKSRRFTCGSSCSAYATAITKFFTDVAAASATTTNVYGVATQYCQGVAAGSTSCNGGGKPITYSTAFGGSFVDGHQLPASGCNDAVTIGGVRYADKYCVTDAQIQTELLRVITAKGWPTDPKTIYFIFLPATVGVCQFPGPVGKTNSCSTNVFCAYHSATVSRIIYAVEPDDAQIPGGGCEAGQYPVGFGADDTISTISHEHNEAITDPFGGGWYAADRSENGDLCAYNFGAALGTAPNGQLYNQTINGTPYYLQQEYSNADGGCLQQPGGTMSPILAGDGAGPLVYHGGAVMLSSTTYAIFWVPAPPANTVLPTITGMPKVGKTLTAVHGTWTGLPKFAYQWLRCSATGTLCKVISLANTSTHILVNADAGHRLEVRVTATNAAGSVYATSAPTGVVKF